MKEESTKEKAASTYLVIRPLSVFWSSINILVDTPSVDHRRVDIELGILRRVRRDVVTPLERSLDQVCPFFVRDQSFLSVD